MLAILKDGGLADADEGGRLYLAEACCGTNSSCAAAPQVASAKFGDSGAVALAYPSRDEGFGLKTQSSPKTRITRVRRSGKLALTGAAP